MWRVTDDEDEDNSDASEDDDDEWNDWGQGHGFKVEVTYDAVSVERCNAHNISKEGLLLTLCCAVHLLLLLLLLLIAWSLR